MSLTYISRMVGSARISSIEGILPDCIRFICQVLVSKMITGTSHEQDTMSATPGFRNRSVKPPFAAICWAMAIN